ncbi:MAG TPA: efflux RND transporter permease subunit [Opitutaceae bacterium]|nr:efflux RND transporter permease subunit [Opitutaceae bacterium]
MHFTDIFIKRPVLATVISLLILLVGYRSIELLNVRQYPVSNSTVVTVSTIYTGASADLIQGFITTPLERQIASADGIDYLSSSSAPSVSTISIYLQLNYDPNAALTQITSKINKVRNQLPAGTLDPVIDVQTGETTAAMYLSFSSDSLDNNQITDYLTRVVQPKLAAVSGVQSAQIIGGRVFAMRIWLKPDKLAAYGISPAQVSQALVANNSLAAVGATKGSMITVNLNAATDLHTADQFRRLVLKDQNGAIIRLGDVADVVLGAQSYDSEVHFGGKAATFIGIYVLPTANALTVIDSVRKVFPSIQAQLPAGLTAGIPYDSTAYIHNAIDEVIQTLVEALAIVVVVIFLFLGSVRSVVIPLVAMPLSLVGACFLMLAMGFTINLLTLLAMVLAIGLVVDDAIVVVENIHRHMEEGMPPLQASLNGARELGGPVIAMTITLAAVYAPIGFQGGLTGTLFREFAFTLVGAVLISGVIALTLSPMMCSQLLKPDTGKKGFAHFLDVTFDRLRDRYEHLLHRALDGWPVFLLIPVVAALLLVPFFKFTPDELAPNEDQGIIIVASQAASDATVDQTALYAKQVSDVFASYPETGNIFQLVGYSAPNTAIGGMVFKPWDQRKRGSVELLQPVTAQINRITGLKSFVFLRPPLPGTAGAPVQFVIVTTDTADRLAQVADDLVKVAQQSGLFYFVDSDLKFDQPRVDIHIDRNKAADLGVNMQEVASDVGSMLGGGYVNYFNIQGNSYQVIPQVERAQRLNPQQLENYYVRTGHGQLVPLSTFATIQHSVQPQSLNHFQQLNAATITAVPGVPLGQALDYLKAQAAQLLPDGYSVDYAGQSRQYVQESGSLVTAFVFGACIIFLVLAAQFESFRDPLIILLGSVPMTLAGAMMFLFLGASTSNIYTKVGLITLVGLIAKHGILIVQFANQLQAEGKSKREAVEHAAAVRLRPILMTTAAMVLGVVPLLIASGAGAASRFALGIVIATGMSVGTCFTLFVVPAVYMLIARDVVKIRARAAEKQGLLQAAGLGQTEPLAK